MRARMMSMILISALFMMVLTTPLVLSSSHREAPFITESPQVDGTDFYMFRSYEEGRDGFVTLVANYNPLQDPFGGPNYFPLDPDAAYDLHVTNDGDPVEDLTFRFRFNQTSPFLTVPVNGENVEVPLVNIGPFGMPSQQGNINLSRTYTVELIRGSVESPTSTQSLTLSGSQSSSFDMPLDNIGRKSISDYETYANGFIHNVSIPGCASGRVFAGQRKESFAVNLGEVFDLINLNPVGNPSTGRSSTEDKNITSLALEVPIDCLTNEGEDVIGGWTTAHLPRTRTLLDAPSFDAPAQQSGDLVQVSRLGMPLVNEVVIGLPDKNRFNASHPQNDVNDGLLFYMDNPSLPELIEILFGVQAPNNLPRFDLFWLFSSGTPGLNFPANGVPAEMMRLNTSIPPVPSFQQNNLGALGGDRAGFPNGRRPGDDVVDIELRILMGALCHTPEFGSFPVCGPGDAPDGLLPYTDQTYQGPDQFDDVFPYLTTPIPGAGGQQSPGDNGISLPRFAVGDTGGFVFTPNLTMKNLSSNACNGRLSIFVDDFQPPSPISFNGIPLNGGVLDVTLPPLQGTFGSFSQSSGGTTGFGFLHLDNCVPGDIQVTLELEVASKGQVVDVIGVSSPDQAHRAYGFNVRKQTSTDKNVETAFAIAPTVPGNYTYTAEFWDLSGGSPVNGQETVSGDVAQFVSQAVPGLPADFEGFVTLSTDVPVYVEALTVASGPGVQGGLQLTPFPIRRGDVQH